MFVAKFDEGCTLIWTKPRSFSQVFKQFKQWSFLGKGHLYCNDVIIRSTGDSIPIRSYIDE